MFSHPYVVSSKLLTLILLFALLVSDVRAPPPQRTSEQMKFHQQKLFQGLYNANDHVTALTRDEFAGLVYSQPHATLVEFYNSFCGFCKRYAPTYKEFAANITAWQGIVNVAAVDCSTDDNNDLCRTFEVMAYPTLRYFPPNYPNTARQLGTEFTEPHDTAEQLRTNLIGYLRNETAPASVQWPQFSALRASDSSSGKLFANLPDTVEYVFLIYAENSTVTATEVMLDLHSLQRIRVRAIDSRPVATGLGLHGDGGGGGILAVVNRQAELVALSLMTFDRSTIYAAIVDFVVKRGLSVPVPSSSSATLTAEQIAAREALANAANEISDRNREIVEHVRVEGASTVYQADLEMAMWYILFHEIPQYAEITSDRLLALQRFISVVNRYVYMRPAKNMFCVYYLL